ncbi:hypothetical protein [Ornithinimicrobium kibberense]|uniref:hypothetical protein n=1 Tax=Ornithinimicrobium kibberense TaxID=282060 RepID=UPI003613D504
MVCVLSCSTLVGHRRRPHRPCGRDRSPSRVAGRRPPSRGGRPAQPPGATSPPS